MALPTPDVEVKTSSDSTQSFVTAYYETRNRRAKLEAFYMNSCARYTTKADISINGAVYKTPAEYEAVLAQQGSGVHYEVESFDSHVINPNFNLDAPDNLMGPNASGAKSQILCQVTGRVQYGKGGRDAPQQTFNEAFVLIPNWDTFGRNPPRNLRRWLIQSQNFRAL